MSHELAIVHIRYRQICASNFTRALDALKVELLGGEKQMRWLTISSVVLMLVAWGVWAMQEQPPDTGLKVGDGVPAYNPIHVAGPDKGTATCPV